MSYPHSDDCRPCKHFFLLALLLCIYDAIRQRIYQSQVSAPLLQLYNAYLYDGWNLIQERTLSQTHTLTNFFVWGKDLSGTMQGAGGIGGLLSSTSGTNILYHAYDANGNLTQSVDQNGTIRAEYQYDAFGNTIQSAGDLAQSNPFRFSTKYHDDHTGLVYYGYRYYNPELGRWVNRDPIGERGGLNVYGFLRNATLRRIDPLGLNGISVEYKPPVPTEIIPDISEEGWGNNRSGVKFPVGQREVKCWCKCVEKNNTKKYHVMCKVSFDAEIRLSTVQAVQLGLKVRQVYGHEQKHILSATLRTQEKVIQWLGSQTGEYKSPGTCDFWATHFRNKAKERLDAALDVTPDHVGTPGATVASPAYATGYEPLDGSPTIEWPDE